MEKEKKFVLGQYFTKTDIVEILVNLTQKYTENKDSIEILEPSAGTRNFIKVLNKKGFSKIKECEIDPVLTSNPSDFFLFETSNKYNLIIGNPPFTKYNLKDSYYYPKKYENSNVKPSDYLSSPILNKEKTQIENAFILKSIKHLKNSDSSIAFVLPISFFIAKKNKEVKKLLSERFSTIIIYQNDKNWFEEPIPCCFAIFTNNKAYQNKIILLYEDGTNIEKIIDKDKLLTEELIPKSYLYKSSYIQKGKPLSEFLTNDKSKYQKDYNKNNVSASNILEKIRLPSNKDAKDYALAVVRVGNSSVGKCGLINLKEDTLNDMFYVLDFKDEYKDNKDLKEKICDLINKNQQHFKDSTIRVGSKSIKRENILNFGVIL